MCLGFAGVRGTSKAVQSRVLNIAFLTDTYVELDTVVTDSVMLNFRIYTCTVGPAA